MKNVICFLLAGVCALVFSGCASILSKSDYPVLVKSQPPGMSFSVVDLRSGDTVARGNTPDTVTLKSGAGFFKSSKYEIRVMRDGSQVNAVQIGGDVDGWYIGNILFGGIIGLLIVDPLTGAMYKLPDEIQVYGTSDMAVLPTLEIRSMEDLTDEQRSQLILVAAAS